MTANIGLWDNEDIAVRRRWQVAFTGYFKNNIHATLSHANEDFQSNRYGKDRYSEDRYSEDRQ